MNRFYFFISLLILSDLCLACDSLNIPKGIREYLGKNDLSYELKPIKFAYEGKYLCQISADFNGDKVEDFAAIMVESKTNKIKTVLFVSKGKSFVHQIVDTLYEYDYPNTIYYSLGILKAGRQQHYDRYIEIPHPGIRINIFEKPCCRYYWSDEKLIQLENFG